MGTKSFPGDQIPVTSGAPMWIPSISILGGKPNMVLRLNCAKCVGGCSCRDCFAPTTLQSQPFSDHPAETNEPGGGSVWVRLLLFCRDHLAETTLHLPPCRDYVGVEGRMGGGWGEGASKQGDHERPLTATNGH